MPIVPSGPSESCLDLIGELDLDSEWYPILDGGSTIAGCGSIGRDSEALDRSEAHRRRSSERAVEGIPN